MKKKGAGKGLGTCSILNAGQPQNEKAFFRCGNSLIMAIGIAMAPVPADVFKRRRVCPVYGAEIVFLEKNMDIFTAIQTRRSTRSYADLQKPIAREDIDVLLAAAMAAPSAGNQQPWHFVVVTDREKLDSVTGFHPYCSMIREANAAILVCGDPAGKKWPAFWSQDCSAAVQNMLLAATALGLGSVWTGVYPDEARMEGCRRFFAIPETVFPFALVPLGWPKGPFSHIDRFNRDCIYDNTWKSRW